MSAHLLFGRVKWYHTRQRGGNSHPADEQFLAFDGGDEHSGRLGCDVVMKLGLLLNHMLDLRQEDFASAAASKGHEKRQCRRSPLAILRSASLSSFRSRIVGTAFATHVSSVVPSGCIPFMHTKSGARHVRAPQGCLQFVRIPPFSAGRAGWPPPRTDPPGGSSRRGCAAQSPSPGRGTPRPAPAAPFPAAARRPRRRSRDP